MDPKKVVLKLIIHSSFLFTEREILSLQTLLTTLDSSVSELKSSLDQMRPAYHQALEVLATERANAQSGGGAARNSLVFHGITPDPLEEQMEGDPEFCRDALETRIKMVFREHLRISREMPLTHIYRVDLPEHAIKSNRKNVKPLVVGSKSLKDKDSILTHTNLLKKEGIFVTEDTTGKKAYVPTSPVKRNATKNKTKISKSGGSGNDLMESANVLLSDHMSSCNSDYAPSSHSGNSSSSVYTD